MAGTVQVFGFEFDFNGAYVVVRREPICNACLSESEVDAQIELLKEDLDAVAKQMKKAIRDHAQRPLGLETR
jgi:hypothetical protein